MVNDLLPITIIYVYNQPNEVATRDVVNSSLLYITNGYELFSIDKKVANTCNQWHFSFFLFFCEYIKLKTVFVLCVQLNMGNCLNSNKNDMVSSDEINA